MDITKTSVTIGGEEMWNVTYHKTGDMIASSRWCDTEEEADSFIEELTNR